MSQVKVLYVRNLTAGISEEKLRDTFEEHGHVERVKKIKDYAFVHFEDRTQAVAAMDALNHTEVAGSELQISLAKPPSDKKKKEEMLRKREQRMMRAMSHNLALPPFPPFPAGYGPMQAANLGTNLYRGGAQARGGGSGSGRGGGGGGMARGFENGWHWGGWGGDGSWAQRGAGPMAPWMGAGENWGHPAGRGGGAYPWSGVNGAVTTAVTGSYGGASRVDSSSHVNGHQRNRKGYSAR